MRSLTAKLILAFLAVSLISILATILLTRAFANREFDKFVSNQYQTELVEELAKFYETQQSWNNLNAADFNRMIPQFGINRERPSNFCVANVNGTVVLESFAHKLGEKIRPEILERAVKIQVAEKTVGYLLIEKPPGKRNPMEAEFINRLDFSLFAIALGVILFAFIFGAILSRTITNPVRELTSATHAIASGKLGQKVSVHSKDEIGELAESFNKMNADLEKSFNLRTQMTADIAHELRTPLSLIIGHAEAVHDGVLPPTKENFEIIREEAERLEKLVNDLRTLSLADAGELALEFQPVNINKLIGDIKTRYIAPLNQNLTLNLQVDSGIPELNLDPNRIAQVLINILENAIRYTPEGGTIQIATKLNNESAEVVIQDSGPGVGAEEAAHLFDRFYRVEQSRARDEGGSGLGLAIAKSIIEMHKGKIWAESEIGEGLKIIIQFEREKQLLAFQ
ncbi:MAG: HAMP domain-containing protein [Anaerolineales bacterium]|nr:HAMP domain-containing protein [Anaerolineales bacterium]